jgi:hypothetical protein
MLILGDEKTFAAAVPRVYIGCWTSAAPEAESRTIHESVQIPRQYSLETRACHEVDHSLEHVRFLIDNDGLMKPLHFVVPVAGRKLDQQAAQKQKEDFGFPTRW